MNSQGKGRTFLSVLSYIFTAFPAAFAFVVPLWGVQLKILSENLLPTLGGWIILTISIVGFVTGIAMRITIEKRREKQKDELIRKIQSQEIDLRKLTSSKNLSDFISAKLCNTFDNKISEKFTRLKRIAAGKEPKSNVSFDGYSQLKKIGHALSICVNEALNSFTETNLLPEKRDVYDSFIFRFNRPDNPSEWLLAPAYREVGLPLSEMTEENTSYMQLYKSQKPFLIYNCKNRAVEDGCYRRDDRDGVEKLEGSIVCFSIYKRQIFDNTDLEILIGISTAHMPFLEKDCLEKEKELARYIQKEVINVFERQIVNELCNYYLHTSSKSNKKAA